MERSGPATTSRFAVPVIICFWLMWGLINASRLHIDIGLDWSTALWYGMPDAIIWASLTPVVAWICDQLPIRRERLPLRLMQHAAIAVVASVGHTAIDTSIHVIRRLITLQAQAPLDTFIAILKHTLHLNLLIYFMIVGFAHFIAYSKRLIERERQTAELRAQLSEARLSALKMQLQPHFLFNTLHTVSGLMNDDVEASQRVLRQLGELLRMSLDNRDRREVELDEELRFVRAYLEIEHARFHDRLQVKIVADPELLGCRVPPLILQPLVENAIHHGVSRHPDGGLVEIHAECRGERLWLQVRDSGPGLPRADASEAMLPAGQGIGLVNTAKRLQELYGEAGLLETSRNPSGGFTAQVWIPQGRHASEPRPEVERVPTVSG